MMQITKHLPRAAAVILLAISALGLSAGTGHAFVEEMISRFASGDNIGIRIEGLSGTLSGKPQIESITVSDPDGAWMRLLGVRAEVNPLALFSGEISLENLAVSRIEVLRKPNNADAQASAGDGFFPALPQVSLRVNHFQIERLVLAEPVLGATAEIGIAGSFALSDDPTQLAADISAQRLDGPEGKLSAKLDLRPGENRFELSADFREAQGGTVVRLLNVPGLPAVAATLTGSGPLDAWAGELAVEFDGERAVSGTAGVTRVADGLRVEAKLDGKVARLIPTDLRAFFAGDATLKLDLVRGEAGGVTIAVAELNSATTQVSLSGNLDAEAGTVEADARLAFASPDTEFAFTLSDGETVELGESRVDLSIKGKTSAANYKAHGSVARFEGFGYTADDVEFSASGEGADLNRRSLPFTLSAKATALSTPQEPANRYLAGPLSVGAQGLWDAGRLKLEKAEAVSAVARLSGTGTAEPAAASFDLDIEASAETTAEPALAPLLGEGRVELAANVVGTAERGMSLNDARLRSPTLSASGEASFQAEMVTADLAVAIDDLSRLRPELAGELDMTVSAGGPVAAPQLTIKATGQSVSVNGKELVDLKLAFDGVVSAANPSGKLSVTAAYGGEPVEASANVSTAENGDRLAEGILIGAAGALIEGSVRLPRQGTPTGTLRFDVPDLAAVAPLILRDDLSGEMKGEVELRERDGVVTADVAAEIPRAQIASVSIRNGKLDAIVRDPLIAPAIEGHLDSAALEAGGTQFTAVSVDAERTGDATNFSGSAKAAGEPVTFAGRLQTKGNETLITLDSGAGRYRGLEVSLKRPVSLVAGGGVVRISDASLAVAGGSVDVAGSIGDDLNLKITLADLPAGASAPLAPSIELTGAISGTVAATGRLKSPRAQFDIDWRDASTQASRAAGAPALNVVAQGTYADGKVDLRSRLTGNAVDLNVAGDVRLSGGSGLILGVNGTVPLELTADRLARSGLQLNGTAAVDLSITGSLAAPAVTGNISTSDAVFIDSGSAIVVKNIASQIALDGSVARIESLTGRLGSLGRVVVAGTIGISPGDGLPADIAIKMTDASYSDGRILTADFNADLTLQGLLAADPVLGGRIEVGRADIQVPSELPQAVSAVEVEHRNAPSDVRRQEQILEARTSAGGPSSDLGLDVVVSAPRRVFVRGRGLDAELGGELKLTGSASAVRPVGSFNLVRGRLSILTRRLELSRGSLTFTGSLIPVLNFAASTTAGDIVASVVIEGAAADPSFEFTSVPSLPEDEVLAILIFDRSLSKLSPLQIAQLASAIATLTGAGGSGGVLDRLRASIGVDDLDITTDEEGGASVGIGKYIGDNLYLGVKQGTSAGSGRVTIDLDITKNLKARGETGADGESKAGIYFEREY